MLRCPGRLPDDDETLTIRPQPRSAITGASARISRIGPITCSSHCACQSSSVSCSTERTELLPAGGQCPPPCFVSAPPLPPELSQALFGQPFARVGRRDVEHERLGAPAG